MSLFERSPNVIYNYTDQILDPKVYTAKNLWRRNDIRDDYLSSVVLFDTIFIKAGDTPESISFNYYERVDYGCLLYTSPSPRDRQKSRMPSSA